MISLHALAALADRHAAELGHGIEPFVVAGRSFDTDHEPVIMGTVNLSVDSTYRESVAPTTASAVRKGRVQAAQGAHLVDVGAESSTARAARVDPEVQAAAVLPVVRELVAEGVPVSVEAYDPVVVEPALAAGACVVNLTGSAHDKEIFGLVAEHGASLVLCHVAAANIREIEDAPSHDDPFPALVSHFESRLAHAREAGVRHIALDPGLGFYYRDLTDPMVRMRFQTQVILRTFRLRPLGLPVCHALPHAFHLFEDEFRSAEGFFAVLASLGGTGVFRTHEVPRVRAVLNALAELGEDVPER